MNPMEASTQIEMSLRYEVMVVHSGLGIGMPVNCAISLKKDPMRHEPELGVAT